MDRVLKHRDGGDRHATTWIPRLRGEEDFLPSEEGLRAGEAAQQKRRGDESDDRVAQAKLEASAEERKRLEPLMVSLRDAVQGLAAVAAHREEALKHGLLTATKNFLESFASSLQKPALEGLVQEVREEIQKLQLGGKARLAVHPKDLDLVKASLPEVETESDPSLKTGEIRVMTEDKLWQAALKEKLDAALSEALRHLDGLDQKTTELKPALKQAGRVLEVVGGLLEADGPEARLGDSVDIQAGDGNLPGEVVGFKKNRVLISPLGELNGVGPKAVVLAHGEPRQAPVGVGLMGRVLDGLGRALDGRPLGGTSEREVVPLVNLSPLDRGRVTHVFETGITVVDSLLTCGKGQRVGIFSGSGVGKSTLLGMLARHSQADAVVIGLIGERGKEVRDFVERELGEEGRARSVVVAATSEQPAQMRIQAALTATAIAEGYRDEGKSVLLLMDSVTRFAHALREIGLARGEPPATKGYPPSMFSVLPKLLERSGAIEGGGSITGFYTVLVEGDNMNEPVADTVRGILDGHLVLSREQAAAGQYPAMDVLASLSRSMPDLASEAELEQAALARRLFAKMEDIRDLLSVGAYRDGSDPLADQAIARVPLLLAAMRQKPGEKRGRQESLAAMKAVLTAQAGSGKREAA